MTAMLPDPPQLDPAALASSEFSRTRRGLEPTEVRAALGRAADAIRTWEERDRQLRSHLEDLEARLVDAQRLDESHVAAVLGEETARIVTAAREAAAEIRSKAEEQAARLLKEADDRATAAAEALRSDAQALHDEATAHKERVDAEVAAQREEAAQAAAELRRSADEYDQRVRSEADTETAVIREEAAALATSTVSAAQTRSDELLRSAESVLAEQTAEAEEASASIREQAAAERLAVAEEIEALRTDADTRAEEMVEAARQHGLEMVEQARAVRERMLNDLAERRRLARRQIEAALAGRDRIIELLSETHDNVGATISGLSDIDADAARVADSAASAVDGTLDEEIDALESLPTPDILTASPARPPAAATDTGSEVIGSEVIDSEVTESDVTGPDASESDASDSDAGAAESSGSDAADPGTAGTDTAGTRAADPDAGEPTQVDAAADQLDPAIESDTEESPAAEQPAVEEPAAEEPGVEQPAEEEPAVEEAAAEKQDDSGTEDGNVDHEVAAVDNGGAEDDGATVHDLFERIRAASDVDPEDLDPADDVDAAAPAGTVAVAAVAEVAALDLTASGAETAESAGDTLTDTDLAGTDLADPDLTDPDLTDTGILDLRDERLAPVEKSLARVLKRLVSDEQNEVLDRLRRVKRGRPDPQEILPSPSAEVYIDALAEDYDAAVTAGIAAWSDLAEVEVIDLTDTAGARGRLTSKVEDFISMHRVHLERTFTEADEEGLDTADIADRLRASYRDWRSSSLGEFAGDLATTGFTYGQMLGAGEGTPWRWVVDNGGLGCADGEDNALAGAVDSCTPFPTGDITPPAHPGCRCILAPAR